MSVIGIQKDTLSLINKADSWLKDSQVDDFVLLKTNKLTSALYAITEFLADADPLKWRLRESALDAMSYMTMSDIQRAHRSIGQLLSFIDLALAGQFVSLMNFSILKQEYADLRQSLWNSLSRAPALSQLSVPSTPPSPATPAPSAAVTLSSKNQGLKRQNTILEFIKSCGGEVSVGDLARLMPDLSTKTIQRDLLDLVGRGQLKKRGQKRWSRYYLV